MAHEYSKFKNKNIPYAKVGRRVFNSLFALYMEIKHPELQDIPTRIDKSENPQVPKLKRNLEPCRRCKHRDKFGDEPPCDECVHKNNGVEDRFYPADCKEDAEQ